jgi:hypothetical protein
MASVTEFESTMSLRHARRWCLPKRVGRLLTCIVAGEVLSLAPLPCQILPTVLPFRWRDGLSYTRMIAESPIILVGEVRSQKHMGRTVLATDDRGNTGEWELLVVNASVQHILRGPIKDASIEFYFWLCAGGKSGDWNALDQGHEYVFLLIRENGVLRAIRDHWRSSIEIGSGSHRTVPPSSNAAIYERIAFLLLTPGLELKPRRFERTLQRAVPLADEWIGSCRTAALLQNLLRNGDLTVRRSAGEMLRTCYGGLDISACAEDMKAGEKAGQHP